jgi:hypothetical protein
MPVDKSPRQEAKSAILPWDGIKFEYKYLTLQPPVSAHMDAMGEEGWELVSAWPEPKKEGLCCVFKRPKRSGYS